MAFEPPGGKREWRWFIAMGYDGDFATAPTMDDDNETTNTQRRPRGARYLAFGHAKTREDAKLAAEAAARNGYEKIITIH